MPDYKPRTSTYNPATNSWDHSMTDEEYVMANLKRAVELLDQYASVTNDTEYPEPRQLPDDLQERAIELREKIQALMILGKLKSPEVSVDYDGYGDSGYAHNADLDWSSDEERSEYSDLEDDLKEFMWDIVMIEEDGFYNNEGGSGQATWNVSTNEIKIDHQNNYESSTTSLYAYKGN